MIKKIGNGISKGLLLVFFVFVAILALPTFFGCHWVTIESGSMAPALPVGSVCFVAPQEKVERGDIITFTTGSKEEPLIVTHRIIGMAGSDEYVTKGDANTVSDEAVVQKDQLLGTVRFCIPYLGPFVRFMSSIHGKIVVCCGFAVLLCLAYLFQSKEQKEEDVPYDD